MAEAVWRAIKSLEKFKGDAKFGTWFHKIVLNECNRLLKLKARHKTEVPLENVYLPRTTGLDSQLEVEKILGSLSGDDQILVQGRLEGLSFDEIGAMLEIEAGTARARWQKIKAGLK